MQFSLVSRGALLYFLYPMFLQLESLSKTFGSFRLEPFSLQVLQGEFFSLLGPSGCGKTTVLRLIGGFEWPTAGKVLLDGQDITALAPHKRNIHTVFQRYALFPHLNVFENVAFSLRLQKVAKHALQERVLRTLQLVQIEDLQHRRTPQLSGGQMQRVALARALINEPKVLLLDEPLSALDPELRMRMREELKALCKKVGSTFLFVTHDQEEALQLSDRMALMKDGKCLQIGTPKAIYEDPVDPFVARFIGPVNEIRCSIGDEQNGALLLVSELGNFKAKKNGVALPKEVTLVLRPEKMRLLRQRSSTQENLVEGEVQELSYLGSRTEYNVKTRQQTLKVFEQELERSKKRNLNVGDRIFLTWKPDDAILFAKECTT
ncbi:MAG: ABC transporter ATP-binding protein [Deltaproteobacteria bacterium]|nr:ABC transporter ATP-binding protein [Deltaproteobacteria bacterium]